MRVKKPDLKAQTESFCESGSNFGWNRGEAETTYVEFSQLLCNWSLKALGT